MTSGEKAHGVKANVKAVQGELYFLEKALIFIAKQPILIDYSKTESISFSRVGAGGLASSRTFDMRVTSRSGSADHVFSAIPKEEAGAISAFLASKNVKLENEMDDAADLADAAMDEDSEDEDMDDADILSSDEERAKKDKGKKGKSKEAAAKSRLRDDDTESGKSFSSYRSLTVSYAEEAVSILGVTCCRWRRRPMNSSSAMSPPLCCFDKSNELLCHVHS